MNGPPPAPAPLPALPHAPPVDASRGTPRTQRLLALWPGTLLCGVIALAAAFIGNVHGGPPLLYALFFGISFHFLSTDAKLRDGVDFCAGTVLRIGVALLGARITATQIAELGWHTAAVVVAAVFSTIAAGVLLARCLGLSRSDGLLCGGATAICGASAALAIAAVLPHSRERDRFTLLVVVGVTSLSTMAMVLYPAIATRLSLPPEAAGLFLGGSIHDVAQVIGAGYMLGAATGDVATVVKLLRVTLLVVVVLAVSAALRRRRKKAARASTPSALVPWFLQVFLLMVAVNSLQLIPPALQSSINDGSRACLIMAIAALGVRTSFKALFEAGWRPLALLLAETVWLAAFVLAAAVWLPRH